MKGVRSQGIAVLAAGLIIVGAAGVWWANAPLSPLPADTTADLLVVEKGGRRLPAYSYGSLLREYPVSLGRSPVGPKERQGDRRTPGVTM